MNKTRSAQQLLAGHTLNSKEAEHLGRELLSGKMDTGEIVELFRLFEKRPITKEEFFGIFQATKEAMVTIETQSEVLDTAGTGGDMKGTFNISTVSAIVCAANNVPVVKHGNRGASSKCGSADVLEALGLNIMLDKTQAQRSLEETGFVFLFAPLFHPSLKHVAEARKAYGKRTFFNFLGPMLNPADAAYQLIGVADEGMGEIMGKSLAASGKKRVWIVRSKDGMDEISPCAATRVREFGEDRERVFTIDPEEYVKKPRANALKGGDAKRNAKIVLDILRNRASKAKIDAVVLNAGGALTVYGMAKTLKEGVALAKETIASGAAKEKLDQIIEVTKKR